MAFSNANYLVNPNRLSTKVHHAPGGASSLSLAWEDSDKPKRQRTRQVEQHLYKNHTQPPKSFVPPVSQFPNVEQLPLKNYYEPSYPGYLSMSQSNRILEEELQYYQNKNKMLRSNLFGNQENIMNNASNYSMKPQHSYQLESSRYTDDDYFSRSLDYGQGRGGGRQTEELEMAIMQQQKRRAIEREESNYNGQYAMGQMGGQMLEKPSVKVSNPPGGRSSIVFG